MPDLGLDGNLDAPFRMYVLRRGDAYYVGWAKTADVSQRIRDWLCMAGSFASL